MEWKLFADLTDHVNGRTVTVQLDSGATVQDAVNALLEAEPALRERVTDDAGELRPTINLLLNGRELTAWEGGLETPVDQNDELALVPPVSGG